MPSFTYQPALRPDLPHIFGPKEYQEERALFIRIDEILTTSGLEAEFIARASEHHGLDSKKLSAKQSEKFYDPDVQVIVRGKSGAEVEFGNKLWLGETREGLIVDYLLEKKNQRRQTNPTRHHPPRWRAATPREKRLGRPWTAQCSQRNLPRKPRNP